MTKYNRRVMIRGWGTTQNEIGSPIASEVAAWEQWAQVEERSGSNFSPYQQTLWQYDYKITLRYTKSRLIGSNYTIDYDGKRLVINSLSISNEAYRKDWVARCTAVDDQSGTGGGGAVTPLPAIGVYNFYFSEFDPSVIAGRYIFWAGKDGISYAILRETGTPVDKQVLNIKSTGELIWSVLFNDTEQGTILYI